MREKIDLKSIDQLRPSALNCNIFSVYDYDGLTITELLCQFYTRINECITGVNNCYDLVEYMVNEGLAIEVALKLNEWLTDGTLAGIINEVLLAEINAKVDNMQIQVDGLGDRQDQVETDFIDLSIELNNKIDEALQDMDVVLNNKFADINLQTCEPMFMCELETHPGSVTQGIAVDKRDYTVYVAQAFDMGDGYEGFKLTKHDANGERIGDGMVINYGGHGTTFGLEVENDRVYIYNTFYADKTTRIPTATTPHKIGRFEYREGVTIDPTDPNITYYGFDQSKYWVPTVSANYDYIALRNDRAIKIFPLDKFKQNNLSEVYELTIPSEYYYLQGFTLDDTYFYWRSGDGKDPENNHVGVHPDTIIKFDFKKGELVETTELFYPIQDGAYEPEDIYLLEREGHKAMVMTGQIGGRYGRLRSLWVLGSSDVALTIFGQSNTPNEKTIPWLPWGKVKWVNPLWKSIKEITNPGYYYLDTATMNAMTDKPVEDASGAYFLFVSPKGKTETNIYQELTRCSTGGGGFHRISRYVNLSDGSTSPWLGNSQTVALWTGNTSTTGAGTVINLKDSINNYDYIYLTYTGMCGNNADDQMIMVNRITTTIAKAGMNFADSTTNNFYFYEMSMSFNADKTTLTVNRQSRYWINTNTMGGNLTDTTFGLVGVYGVRM